MRGTGFGVVLAAIGVIYAIGLVIHFWWIFVVIMLIIGVHDGLQRWAKTHPKRPTQAKRNTSQAQYSNRR